MINITINYERDLLEIENKDYNISNWTNNKEMEIFLKDLLDKVYYGGEKVCLEIKDRKLGNYTLIDEWL